MTHRSRTRNSIVGAALWALLVASAPAKDEPAANADAPSAAPASTTAQRVYERTRMRLVQVRTLLKAQDSQSSVGSGFLVSDEGHLITNYHVVSEFALRPQRHRLVYASADGQQGALQLIGVDVVHDLALLKPVDARALAGRGAMVFRPAAEPPARGARIFALGNPLDVGFAVTEGSYNGFVERGFVPTLFFGGSLSPGMSGGPTLDESGRVIGINVATRRDGEQVSFLVPAEYAHALLQRGAKAQPVTASVYPEVTRQLQVHQGVLTERFIAQGWRNAGHARYAIPLPREDFLRCWGHGSPQSTRGLQFERSDCEMESRIYVGGALLAGYLTLRHEAYDGRKLGALRFAERYSASFRNENFGADGVALTAPQCHERNIDRDGLPLRALMCLRAYKKLTGLYNVSVLVASLDQADSGVQGRFDAYGVSFENAQRLAAHYLAGYAWTDPKTAWR